jgi:NADH-quinone oxidoreductase subunit L
VCSYLLISFWFTHEPNAVAGKKAFITNRVGDVGFLLATLLAFTTVGTVQYTELLESAGSMAEVTATALALLLFLGAIGKSAQLPLYFWLPDAMAGPTPVSALIHAATMVTSGVYLMVRINPVLAQAPDALTVVAWVGAITALFAATVAVAQRDIKKVLAYSTVSQLGYMFLAVGSGAYVAAIFHMVTHAFFKALLFLGSGSVIHSLHDEQDMDRMGGLARFLPITAGTFIVGWLAIAGIPPFSGFWSKDEILINAWDKSPALWVIGAVTALLTAYYMSRQVFLVFFGEERWRAEADAATDAAADEEPAEPHEAPAVMTVPLLALAGLALVGGALNLPFRGLHFLEEFLEPVFEGNLHHVEASTSLEWGLPAVVLAMGVVGIAAAWWIYLRGGLDRHRVEPAVLERSWYFDDAVTWLVGGPGRQGALLLSSEVDAGGVDGAANGLGWLVQRGGRALRVVQSGFIRSYALGIAAGSVLLLGWFAVRAGI